MLSLVIYNTLSVRGNYDKLLIQIILSIHFLPPIYMLKGNNDNQNLVLKCKFSAELRATWQRKRMNLTACKAIQLNPFCLDSFYNYLGFSISVVREKKKERKKSLSNWERVQTYRSIYNLKETEMWEAKRNGNKIGLNKERDRDRKCKARGMKRKSGVSLRYTNARAQLLGLEGTHNLFLEGIYSVWSLSHPACFAHLHFLGFYTLSLPPHAHPIPTSLISLPLKTLPFAILYVIMYVYSNQKEYICVFHLIL